MTNKNTNEKLKGIKVVADGKPADLSKLPCATCKYNYSFVCPNTEWCIKHEVIPYMPYEQYKRL